VDIGGCTDRLSARPEIKVRSWSIVRDRPSSAAQASHADERREHEEAIKRHQAEYNRLNDRIHAM
jgi:hypothetical protein